MLLQNRMRGSYTTLEQKLWILKHREENKKISLARIAMDFSTEFNRAISISGISRIISQKDELLALSNADPEIETKRVKKMVSLNRIKLVYIGRGLTDKLQPLDSAHRVSEKRV